MKSRAWVAAKGGRTCRRAVSVGGIRRGRCRPAEARGRGAGAGRRDRRRHGDVQVGKDGAWKPAAAEQKLFEGQTIKTGAKASRGGPLRGRRPVARRRGHRDQGRGPPAQGALEKAKRKIAAPTDSTKVEMQVTPLTGVRGTDKTE